MFPGYKTGAGIDPDLYSQFPLLEEALVALGITTWPMVEYEADDALAAAAAAAARDPRVDRVIICTPDKDLAQCVRGTRVVQRDRRARTDRDEAGVIAKFGVPPASIPDYLALVGDTSDGYPGLDGWGAKSAAAVLAKFGHLESIPADWRTWGVNASRPGALAQTLERERDRVLLFRDLATLRDDIPLFDSVDELKWPGPTPTFQPLAARLEAAVADPRQTGTSAEALRLNMSMKTILRALIACLLFASPAAAAEQPNFSGDWKMNAAKSTFGPLPAPTSITRKITHAEPSLTIVEDQTSDMGVQNTTRKYTTDGKEMTFESQGAHVTSSAVWDGSVLVVVSTVAEIGVQFTDRMSLSEDGKTLISSVRITSAQGDLDLKVVFDRQ